MRLFDYAASGNCYKVRLLLALLDEPYERVETDIFAGATLTDAYGRLNPLRETPVLVLDDGEVLAQSNAILWYLAEGTPWLPEERLGRARVAQWLAFEQERVMGGIGGPRFRILTGRASAGDPALAARLAVGREGLDVLELQLRERPFLLGPTPTIADVSVFAYAHVAPDAGLELSGWPAVESWCERIRALPGFLDDYVPYPPNARPGAGRSIYD
jgi:glutathione S-transferase